MVSVVALVANAPSTGTVTTGHSLVSSALLDGRASASTGGIINAFLQTVCCPASLAVTSVPLVSPSQP